MIERLLSKVRQWKACRINDALLDAIQKQNISSCKKLLSLGADPNSRDHGTNLTLLSGTIGYERITASPTALMIACRYNTEYSVSIIKTLLDHGADLDDLDANRNSAQLYAIEYANIDHALLLALHGANLDQYTIEQNPTAQTAQLSLENELVMEDVSMQVIRDLRAAYQTYFLKKSSSQRMNQALKSCAPDETSIGL